MKMLTNSTEIALEVGDITAVRADAIVNAANSSLLGGGGVDGAIHRVGGPAILEECKKIREQIPQGLPPGEAVITTAGFLRAKNVIHTVGPVWRGGTQDEPKILGNCYSNCLKLACEHGLKTVAFPSISTGAYGYPIDLAASVAFDVAHAFLGDHVGELERVVWVLFDRTNFDAYQGAFFK